MWTRSHCSEVQSRGHDPELILSQQAQGQTWKSLQILYHFVPIVALVHFGDIGTGTMSSQCVFAINFNLSIQYPEYRNKLLPPECSDLILSLESTQKIPIGKGCRGGQITRLQL